MPLLMLAMMVQAAPAVDVTPERCVAVANRVEYYFTLAKSMIDEITAKTNPTDADKAALAGVAADRARIATIRSRYPNAKPDAAMETEVKGYDAEKMHNAIEVCAK